MKTLRVLSVLVLGAVVVSGCERSGNSLYDDPSEVRYDDYYAEDNYEEDWSVSIAGQYDIPAEGNVGRGLPHTLVAGQFHLRQKLLDYAERGSSGVSLAYLQAHMNLYGTHWAEYRQVAAEHYRQQGIRELEDAIRNIAVEGNGHRSYDEKTEAYLAKVPEPTFTLCIVCYKRLDWLKNSTWRAPGTNNLRYLDEKVLSPPPPLVRHVETELRFSGYTSPPPPYFTEVLRGASDQPDRAPVLFIHKPPNYLGWWGHLGTRKTYRLTVETTFGEMGHDTFRKWTMSNQGRRVLCKLCFSEEDLLQLKAKFGVRDLKWQVINPNEWAEF